MKKKTAVFLAAIMLMSGMGVNAVHAQTAEIQIEKEMVQMKVTDFAVRLFQSSLEEEKNTLISPLSVMYALTMTANGAEEETLAQMEEVLGLPIEELNIWFHTYMDELPEEEAYKLSLANGIWFKEDPDFQIEEGFLEINEEFYNSRIEEAPFDETTLQEINEWVEENTDGMIKDMLDQISEDAIMYLVNALAFDAKWAKPYNEYQVSEGVFTTEDHVEQVVEMMSSKERHYLEDEEAVGFLKYYEDETYAFAALMPKEGINITDYVAGITGEHIQELLGEAEEVTVHAGIPKFETGYSVEMREILKAMGMTDAFDVMAADFSGIGSYKDKNIFMNQVLHKTFISVAEEGTSAGAATVAAMLAGSAMIEEIKEVQLNRPFVYMLIDCENKIPFFIGTMMDMEEAKPEK